MRLRVALVAGMSLVTVLVASADAAPVQKSCNLVTDPAGDVSDAPGFPKSNSLDVIGADIASDGTNITAVVRLASFEQNELPTYAGKRFWVEFKPASAKYPLLLAATFQPQGGVYHYGYKSSETSQQYPGNGTGKVEGSTITITAKLADLAGNANIGKIPKGTKITGFKAGSMRRFFGVRQFTADEAVGKATATYAAGAASCVKVG